MIMKVEYKVGNATQPIGDGKKLIFHVCNDEGGWGSGFVLGLNKEFGVEPSGPRGKYHSWYGSLGKQNAQSDFGATGPFKLGQVQYVKVKDDTTVVNCIAQSTPGGFTSKVTGKTFPPVRYQSLEECLLRVRDAVEPAIKKGQKISLHSPRLGCGLAGGSWEVVDAIIKRVFDGLDVTWTVYDLPERK